MIFTSLLPLLGLVSLAVADPIRMPLVRRNLRRTDPDLEAIRNVVDFDRMSAKADFLRARYGFKPATNNTKRGQTVDIPVVNQVSLISSHYDLHSSELCGPRRSLALKLLVGI